MEKTLRDELAMSLPFDAIPTINPIDLKEIGESLGLSFDEEDYLSMIQFSADYQAIIRYQYADAMIKERNKI